MKTVKLVYIILVIAIFGGLLFGCANSAMEQSQTAASGQASIMQNASLPSEANGQQPGLTASALPAVSTSPTQSRVALPDDNPNVTGSESALIVNPNEIYKSLPIKNDIKDGKYAGIIANLFTVSQGMAVDFDEVNVSGGTASNDSAVVMFLQLDSKISYTLPDGTKKTGVDTGSGLSDLKKYFTQNSYFTITVSGSKITDIEYGGKVS